MFFKNVVQQYTKYTAATYLRINNLTITGVLIHILTLDKLYIFSVTVKGLLHLFVLNSKTKTAIFFHY